MFEYEPPPDKFRALAWISATLLAACVVWIAVVLPLQKARRDRDYPMPAWARCAPNGFEYSSDGGIVASHNPVIYSPGRKFAVVLDNPCPGAPSRMVARVFKIGTPTDSFEKNVVLALKTGRSLQATWISANELLIQCIGCQDSDVEKADARFDGVSITYEGLWRTD